MEFPGRGGDDDEDGFPARLWRQIRGRQSMPPRRGTLPSLFPLLPPSLVWSVSRFKIRAQRRPTCLSWFSTGFGKAGRTTCKICQVVLDAQRAACSGSLGRARAQYFESAKNAARLFTLWGMEEAARRLRYVVADMRQSLFLILETYTPDS